MGTFLQKNSLTIFQLDFENQTGKRMHLLKNPWVENVPHHNHTKENHFDHIQKVNLHSKIHLVPEGR